MRNTLCSSLGAVIVLAAMCGAAKAQNVTVVQTNGDQSALLQLQPSVAFSAQNDLPIAIRVDDGIRFQQMDGFGASFTDSSAWLVGTKLSPEQRSEVMHNLFTSDGAGLSFLRQPMGATDLALTEYSYDDLPAGQTDPDLLHFSIDHDKAYVIPVLQQALATNPRMRIMALPWSPPAWMKTNGSMRGGGFQSQFLPTLAQYFVKFIKAYHKNGIPIHFVAAQNEPFFAGTGYPTEFFTDAQEAEFIGKHLGPALDRLAREERREDRLEDRQHHDGEHDADDQLIQKPLILGWEHNWDIQWYGENLLNNPVTSRYLAGISFHCYAGDRDVAQGSIQELFPDKGIWFTECTGVTTSPNFHNNLGFNMHNLLIGSVREGARSVILWNMALDQEAGPTNGNGCHTCRGVITVDWSTTPATVRYEVEYYSLGQLAKFVVPGAHRIDSNIAGPIESVAFQNPDGSIVLVAYNSSTATTNFSVNWRGKVFTYTLTDGSVATFKWDPATGRDFAVAATPASHTVAAGQPTNFQLTVSRFHGFRRDVDFSVSGLPLGASARICRGQNEDQPVVRIRTSGITPPGTYPITITGTQRSLSRSATIQLVVGPPEAAFGGASLPIPGRIEAEDFDIGGEGVAYHDIDFFPDPDSTLFRPGETVDLETTTDTGGGFDVGFTQPGGWMRYTVNVAKTGLYSVKARVAFQGSGGLFHVELDGRRAEGFEIERHDRDHDCDDTEDRGGGDDDDRTILTNLMHVPNTGGFQKWATISSSIVRLRAGEHILRIVFDSKPNRGGIGNFNWVDVEPVDVAAALPFHGAPSAIPGKIQAEDFDNGGQNVGYYDEATKNQGGQYRPTERIGIETTTDVGGGFDVGFTSQGEWLNYTVNVAASGWYTLHVRVASQPSGGTFHFALDGRDVSGVLSLPATGGFQTWTTMDVPNVRLEAGVHILQLVMDGPGSSGSVGNFNWFSFD